MKYQGRVSIYPEEGSDIHMILKVYGYGRGGLQASDLFMLFHFYERSPVSRIIQSLRTGRPKANNLVFARNAQLTRLEKEKDFVHMYRYDERLLRTPSFSPNLHPEMRASDIKTPVDLIKGCHAALSRLLPAPHPHGDDIY
jgi:hypothetical protein